MYVNKCSIPHHHQRDWLDLSNDLINRSSVLLNDDVLPRIIRRQADPYAMVSQGIHQQLAQNDPNKFEVKLDVSNFNPEEICVKAVGNSLVIEGKHEERLDNDGYVSKLFTWRYELEDNVDLDQLVSSLSHDGKLTVRAPNKIRKLEGNERVIPITYGENQLDGSEVETMKGSRGSYL